MRGVLYNLPYCHSMKFLNQNKLHMSETNPEIYGPKYTAELGISCIIPKHWKIPVVRNLEMTQEKTRF